MFLALLNNCKAWSNGNYNDARPANSSIRGIILNYDTLFDSYINEDVKKIEKQKINQRWGSNPQSPATG